MKKHLLILTLLSFMFINYTYSQLVTISATHQLPVIGDSIRYVDANTFGFDAAGTGPVTTKVWDFGALMNTGTTVDFVFVDPATLSASDGNTFFPNATLAKRQSDAPGYFYYENTANNINRVGAYVGPTNYMVYEDATVATEFHFPITAGGSFNTTYHGAYAPFGLGEDSCTIESGTLTINADMQGQMILPTGTFNSTLRLHVVESFHIKVYMFGTAALDYVISDDYYYWFVDSVLQPLVIYGVTTIDGTAQTPVLRYQPITITSSVNNEISSGIKIYPIPSTGVFNLIDSDRSNTLKNITITDINGKLILKKFDITDQVSQVDLTGNIPGTYFIKIEQNGKTSEQKIILK